MVKKNSGIFYQFNVDHNLGVGIAEVYDFTDEYPFDGCLVYVYNNRHEFTGNLDLIRESGVAIGPVRMNKFPNTRGRNSWKYLFKTDNYLITELPASKELKGLEWKDDNWNNFKTWYISKGDLKETPQFVDYDTVRHLETRTLYSQAGVVKKFTMKIILDNGGLVPDYYDLSDIDNRTTFIHLVNTYYPLSKTKKLLQQLPTHSA